MLDIRATRYTSPAKEVEFASVPLSVRLVNVADEPAHVTGQFRVYDKTLGLLIFESVIEPVDLAAAATVDVSALTDWDPATPADDRYFVQFDGTAVNDLVPDGIPVTIGAWHFDVKTAGMGPAPAAHAPTHEAGGADELEVADLATAEVDDSLVLAPDGVGGVEWRAEVGGGGGAHATTHEAGGADELEVADLATAEVDDSLVLAPDGAGGVEWRAEVCGLTPFPLMTTAEMNAVPGPTEGMVIWNTDMHFPCAHDGTSWKMLPLMDQPEP